LCFTHDEKIGWRFVSGLRARLYHAGRFHTVHANRAGFRSDQEFVREKKEKLRLAVLGDSYAAGDGVHNGERFTDVIAGELAGVEVCNFGMPGSGPDQQVLIGEQVADLAPDAWLFCVSDLDIFRLTVKAWPTIEWGTGVIRYRAKPYFELDQGDLVLRNTPVPKGTRLESQLGEWGPVGFLTPKTSADWDAAYREGSPPRMLLDALLQRFLEGAKDVPVFLIPLPSPLHGLNPHTAPHLETFQAAHNPSLGRFFVNVLPAFEALSANDRRRCYFDTDPHYTAYGHSVVAKAIIKGIRDFIPGLFENGEVSRGDVEGAKSEL